MIWFLFVSLLGVTMVGGSAGLQMAGMKGARCAMCGITHTMKNCPGFSVTFKYLTSDKPLYFIMVFIYILNFLGV